MALSKLSPLLMLTSAPPRVKPTHTWALFAVICVAAMTASYMMASYGWLSQGWTLALGLAALAVTSFALFLTMKHPRLYPGKGIVLVSLCACLLLAYLAFGQLARDFMTRRTFQLQGPSSEFQDPVEGWSVSHPSLWTREEKRVSGTVSQLFKPSQDSPAIFFSVTSRNNVGTDDLDLIVQGFFMNLPKDKNIEIAENESMTLPNGLKAQRIVYGDATMKNEVILALHNTRLFMLSVGAAPGWFDRNRTDLERLLYSLRVA